VPESTRELPDGTVLAERRWLEGGRVRKTVHCRHADGRQSAWEEDVRLYGADEFQHLATAAGLRVEGRWSSLRGEQIDDGRWVWWLGRA
jgi:hypothetical protein